MKKPNKVKFRTFFNLFSAPLCSDQNEEYMKCSLIPKCPLLRSLRFYSGADHMIASSRPVCKSGYKRIENNTPCTPIR